MCESRYVLQIKRNWKHLKIIALRVISETSISFFITSYCYRLPLLWTPTASHKGVCYNWRELTVNVTNIPGKTQLDGSAYFICIYTIACECTCVSTFIVNIHLHVCKHDGISSRTSSFCILHILYTIFSFLLLESSTFVLCMEHYLLKSQKPLLEGV